MILKIFYCLLAALFYSWGVPSVFAPHFFLGSTISMVFYFLCLEGKFKNDLWITFIFVFGIYMTGYYWIPQTISEFGELPLFIAYSLSIFFPFILMPQFFIFIFLYFLIKNKIDVFSLPLKHCFLAFLLTILEYFIPQQFPANVGHPYLSIAPYIGLAKIFGVPIFSFFSIWLSLAIVSLITKRGRDYFALSFFIIFLIFNFLFPLKYKTQETNISTRIRMVQSNIGNFLKVDAEKGGETSNDEIDKRFLALSTRPSEKKIDLIIWPETAYPKLLFSRNMRGNDQFTPFIMKEILSKTNSQMFFGGYDNKKKKMSEPYETTYNAAFLIDKNGFLEDVYQKQILLPFGESLPFGPLNSYFIPYLEDKMSFFAKGERFTLFKIKNNSSFIAAICYEILFPQYIRNYLNSSKEQAQFIINLTNDSWYGRTSEPYQHLFLAHWRAVEFNIPIIRMTNTGISSVLYPDGSESSRTKLYSQENLDLDLITYPRTPTIYQKWGIIPFCIIFLFIYFGMLIWLKRKIFRLRFK